jgi:outer membrane protein TolC
VRNAFLDLEAAASQIEVAQKNIEVNDETLVLTRQKLDAGISDNLAVVQSEEDVASARLDYINSLFAHNIAKLSLARALGRTTEIWQQFLTVK